MAECGICLDRLQSPVSCPCGHVHCEKCLYAHISSGADALKSTCPTCRKSFHIATPDFKFVPQKYHNYILPCVRKIYMDIPSVTALKGEIALLTQSLESCTQENEYLRQRCKEYKHRLKEVESERDTILGNEEEAQHEAAMLYDKYVSLKKRYREAQSHDDACSSTSAANLSRRSSQISNTSRTSPKEEESAVSLHALNPNPPRPKRALPRPRLSNSMLHKDETLQTIKRQRTHRHSDVGSSSRSLEVVFKTEDEEYE